jgi:hypothetical protein
VISTVDQIRAQLSILPILVLYKMRLSDSPTYQTFCESSRNGGRDPALIAVYDNSPERQVSLTDETRLLAYKHDPDNNGLAAAYNWALNLAHESHFSWLLLLDQDTKLPATFLPYLVTKALQYDMNDSVAAIAPFVIDNGVSISPKRVRLGRRTSVTRPTPEIAEHEVTAINSGVAVKVPFVMSIGGFNPAYRLDCLDHWFFRQVYSNRKRVALSGQILDHNLSVSDYRRQVSLDRYRSILTAEAEFITTQKSPLELCIYAGRLAFRAAKQLVIYRSPELCGLTCRMIAALGSGRPRFIQGSPDFGGNFSSHVGVLTATSATEKHLDA